MKCWGSCWTALFHPDFSDAEAQQEVYQIGVATEPQTGQRWLTEQGTVYTEMHSQQGMYDSWYALLKLVLGPDHPLTFQAGGTPDAIRRLTPQEIRRFHRQHYILGPSTPLMIVMDRQQPPEQVLTALARLLVAFHPPSPTPHVRPSSRPTLASCRPSAGSCSCATAQQGYHRPGTDRVRVAPRPLCPLSMIVCASTPCWQPSGRDPSQYSIAGLSTARRGTSISGRRGRQHAPAHL